MNVDKKIYGYVVVFEGVEVKLRDVWIGEVEVILCIIYVDMMKIFVEIIVFM